MFIAGSHWSGSLLLVYRHHWILTGTSISEISQGCPQSLGDAGVMVPQDQSLHQLQKVLEVRVDASVGHPQAHSG